MGHNVELRDKSLEKLSPNQKLDGMGRVIARANDIDPDSTGIFLAQNFLTANQVAPYPAAEIPIAFTTLAMGGLNENLLIPPHDPSLLKWYSERVCPGSTIHQVPILPGPSNKLGYPYGDVVHQFFANLTNEAQRGVLITTFANMYTAQCGAEAEFRVPQDYDGRRVNNKALLRDEQAKYNYSMLPGMVVRSRKDIQSAIDFASKYPQGIWAKADGSGGETVKKVPKLNQQSFDEMIQVLNRQLALYIDQSDLPPEVIGQIINRREGLPSEIVIEADGANVGEVLCVGSNLRLLDKNGNLSMINDYAQLTENGVFLGSLPLKASPAYQKLIQRGLSESEIQDLLSTSSEEIGRFMHEQRFTGLYGEDYLLIVPPSGDIKKYVIEVNGRNPMSGIGEIAMSQQKASTFLHTILESNGPLNNLADFRALLTAEGKCLMDGDPKRGVMAIPTIPGSFWVIRDGVLQPAYQSKVAKILFLGQDPEKIQETVSSIIDKK